MTNWTTMPHENLLAYQVARDLLMLVRDAKIADPKLRDQALRAAKSVCLNIALCRIRHKPSYAARRIMPSPEVVPSEESDRCAA